MNYNAEAQLHGNTYRSMLDYVRFLESHHEYCSQR